MPKRKSKTPPTLKFHVGDKVRVKPGFMDTEYPDIPLGGWARSIVEIHDDGIFMIRWSKETLASIHPVFKKRCEKDGLYLEQYWLGPNDLELDTGGLLKVEQPNKIITKPLSEKVQDDRIRLVFGLTSNDPLPDPDDDTLHIYHKHLLKKLAFPFTAIHGADYGHPERVNVIGLGDPDDSMIDEMDGILCEARLGGQFVMLPLRELADAQGKSNRQLIEDYCEWSQHW